MDEKKKVALQVIEAGMQGIFEQLDMEELSPDSIGEWLGEFAAFTEDKPTSYTLENMLVIQYLNDLCLPDSTEPQWQVGRILANNLLQPMLREPDAKGRPSEEIDRVFLCIHVEWCQETHKMKPADALELTALRFNVSPGKLESWYGRAGKAHGERTVAAQIVDVISDLTDLLNQQDVASFIPDSLLNDLNQNK